MKRLPLSALSAISVLASAHPALAEEWDATKSCICRLGDINGDGIPDFVVASRDEVVPELVWIVSGKDGSVLRTLHGAEPRDGFGWSIDSPGDMDGDGVPDLLVGARGWSPGPSNTYISPPYVRLLSGRDGHIINQLDTGGSAASAGDVDGDGVPDVLVSSWSGHPSWTPSFVTLHSGCDGGILYRLTPPTTAPYSNYFGTALLAMGDLDHDGASDFAIGSADGGKGCVALYSGKHGGMIAAVEGEGVSTELGWSLARAGDLDGDGVADLLVGAFSRYARVLSGKDLHTIHHFPSHCGYATIDAFASTLDSIGDINCDGYPDLIVGANEYMMFDQGYAEVYSGRDGSRLRTDFDSDSEGVDVCGIDDVNGDGVPDELLAIVTREWCGGGHPCEVGTTRVVLRIVSGQDGRTVKQIDMADLRAASAAEWSPPAFK